MTDIESFKGVVKNYRIDTVEKLRTALKAFNMHEVAIDVDMAREKFNVVLYTGATKIITDEFDSGLLDAVVALLEEMGFIYIGSNYYSPYEVMVFIKPLFTGTEMLMGIFHDI